MATTRPHAKRWRWAEPRTEYVRRSQVWLGGDLDTWVRHMRSRRSPIRSMSRRRAA